MWFASPHPKHPAVGGGGRALKGLGGSPEAIGVVAATGAGAGGTHVRSHLCGELF